MWAVWALLLSNRAAWCKCPGRQDRPLTWLAARPCSLWWLLAHGVGKPGSTTADWATQCLGPGFWPTGVWGQVSEAGMTKQPVMSQGWCQFTDSRAGSWSKLAVGAKGPRTSAIPLVEQWARCQGGWLWHLGSRDVLTYQWGGDVGPVLG